MVLSKHDLIECLQNEIRILVHLCGKVKPEMLDYRPTPKQRSTMELLRYLTVMGPVLVASVKAGSFQVDQWTAGEARAAQMDFDAVVSDLSSQAALYAELLNGFTDDELRTEANMFGNQASKGLLLVNMVLCGHAAYRTQLFCYLKACGRDELNTMNLWAGVDGSM